MNPAFSHLNRQIPPEAHTPMYNWHKFWSRKTWNVVAEFIKTYSPNPGVVFDPYAGSGVVALEALKNGRRVIVSDILPIATELIRLTIKPVSLMKLDEAYRRIEKKVKSKVSSLYTTQCRNCGYEFPFTCAIWNQERTSQDRQIKRKCIEVRYQLCPRCGDRKDKTNPPTSQDRKLIKRIDDDQITDWYPKNRLYHSNGRPFLKKEKYESIDELFTRRNLKALSWIMAAIDEEGDSDLQDFLKISFSSMVHLATCMMPDRPTRPFSGGWTEHSYWFAPLFMEQNVWDLFESAVVGKQGIINAKEESNRYFSEVRFGTSYDQVINNEADIYINRGSSLDLMGKMERDYGKGCIDYIFTDPPYDGSIQYGELAYLWVAWLKQDDGYLDMIASDEVIRNERQDKDFDVYHSLLSGSFNKMYSVLKPDKYLTVTFHNPTFKVRNATIRAGVFSGFVLQKIHHQEIARPSAKSLLQPFGSAQGDFYLRFYKPKGGKKPAQPETIDENRFEKIVVDTAIRILAERGEETPYTIIINAVDPELAQRGFFSELHTGLDIKTVLQNHLDAEFTLVPAKKGGVEGSLWWFKDPSIVSRLETVPLTERVEQTVLRKLQQSGKLTFTEAWNAVSVEFPNSLTSDSMSVKEALQAYARPVVGGYWLIKRNLRSGEIEREHTHVIATLAEIGKALGYKIWVGNVEQSHPITTFPHNGQLKQYVTQKSLAEIKNIQNLKTVEDIDLLWIKDKEVVYVFEVESTTQMTEALQRGSNVDSKVPKFLVTPQERENQLLTKLRSPMFRERFAADNWNTIYFEALIEEFTKHKGKTKIERLIDKKVPKTSLKLKGDGTQLGLFSSDQEN